MGSAIAAYLAGAGIPVELLDMVPEGASDRDTLSKEAIKKLHKTKPPYLFSPRDTDKIRPGNLEDHLDRIKEVDWIIEAVVERLDIKRSLFEKIEQLRSEDSIVSSNTSGISLAAMTEGFSESFQSHFLVTHFFNPVRYMKLLEIVPGPKTTKEVLDRMVHFGEKVLGKGIVHGKDTPNFIANRIGVYSKMLTIHEAFQQGLRVEEVDELFGPLMGRPKSALYRTADIVGLDTTANVVSYIYEVLKGDPERDVFTLPEGYKKMMEKGFLGQKAQGGFYKVEKKEGEKKILALDFETFSYREQMETSSPSLERAKGISDLKERLRALILEEDDKLARFARKITFKTLLYALGLIPKISDDIRGIDNAMKWGYNYELGLFETWDALGLEETAKKMEEEGYPLPENLKKILQSSEKAFYTDGKEGGQYFDFKSESFKKISQRNSTLSFRALHEKNKILFHNGSVSILDLDDGILALEIHTEPLNMIDRGVFDGIFRAVEIAEKNYKGLLFANQGKEFCIGVNLALMFRYIRRQNWEELSTLTDRLQQCSQALRYCTVPVVGAPFGRTAGGGCELMLAVHHLHSFMELQMGFVEVAIGIIPAGSGCLSMLKRLFGQVPSEVIFDQSPLIRPLFDLIFQSKISTSAMEARNFGFLHPRDTITFNRNQQIAEAKKIALALAEAGFRPEEPWQNFTLPGENLAASFKQELLAQKEASLITEYDLVIGEKLGHVLSGGKVSSKTPLSENYILELEKEAFLSLVGDKRTLQRMEHLLKTGTLLRN